MGDLIEIGRVEPDDVLESAKGVYEELIVIGFAKDGMLDVRSSHNVTERQALWTVEQFKRKLLEGEYGE